MTSRLRRDTEVEETHFTRPGQEDVVRLDVAVRHAARVRVCERVADGGRDAQRLGDRQARRSDPAQARPERLAGQQLHHDEPGVAVAIEVVEPHHVRMRNGLRLAELALQARDALRTLAQLRAEQLDRDPPAVAAQVHGAMDRRGSAIADLGFKQVASAQQVGAGRGGAVRRGGLVPFAGNAAGAAAVGRRGDFAPGASSLVTSSARSSVKSGTSGSASAGTSRLRSVPWTPLTAS